MPSSRTLSLVSAVVAILLFIPLACFGQSQGIPWYTIPLPIPNGFVDAATGNVHLEIPIGSAPQRNGDPLVAKVTFDSTQYVYDYNISRFNTSGPGWRTFVGTSHYGTATYQSSSQDCISAGYSGYPIGSVTKYFGFSFQDSHGTWHAIVNNSIYTKQVNCSTNQGVPFGSSADITSTSGSAADGSGYSFQVSNYTQIRASSPDGWLVYDSTGASGSNWPQDTNGNYVQGAVAGTPDTLGRSVFNLGFYSCASTSNSITARVSDGSTTTYIFTCNTQSVSQVSGSTTYTSTEKFLTSIALPDGTQYSFTYDTGTTGTHLGGLSSVTLPSGGVVSLTYVPGVPSLAQGAINLAGRAASVAFGGGTWNLSYVQDSSNLQVTTTVLSPSRYDSASNTAVSDKTVFTSVPYFSYLQTAQYYSGSSTLLRTINTTYDSNGNFLPVTVTTTLNDTGQSSSVSYQYFNLMRDYPTQKQETDFSGSVIRTTKTTYNGFMKPTSVNIYAGSGTGSPISSTLFTYDEYAANYCTNGVPGITSVTGATGHNDAYGATVYGRGNVTTIQRLISGTTYATSHMCYDTLGNVTQVVDANGNPTNYDYSENWADTSCILAATITHAFPTTVTDALGHRTKKSYFTCTSLTQSEKDENDIQAGRSGNTFTYDIFGRPLTQTDSSGGKTSRSYSSSVPPNSTSTTLIDSTHNLGTQTNMDTYARVAQTQLTTDPEGTTSVDTTYDAAGRVATVSNPHRSASAPTDGTTATNYDAFGRVTQVAEPDGSKVTTSLSGTCTTSMDEAGKARKSCTDALGYLTQVLEDPTGFTYETDYTYDVLGNVLTVNQKGGSISSANWRTRTFTYDGLSRLQTASNPESGTVTYTYDANGNLTSKTSPAPNQTGSATITVSYCYDALNRVTSKAYTAQSCPMSSPAASYLYDSATIDGFTIPNPVGRLVRAATTGSFPTATYYTYDSMGRITNRGECVYINHCGTSQPTLWVTSYTYDLRGDVTSYTDASGHTFTQSFDGAARPLQLTSSWIDSAHPSPLLSADPLAGYFPNGALKKATFGNGLIQTFVLNPRLQPCRIATNSAGTPPASCSDANTGNVLDFSYGYNLSTGDNGDIVSWNASGNQQFTRSFTYDSLNRLATMSQSSGSSGSCGSVFSLSWSNSTNPTGNIDPWGNLTDQTVTGGSCYALHQAVNTRNQFMTGSYDAAGNLLGDGVHNYSYDSENRIQYVDGGSSGIYVYDADGRRVGKAAGTVTTYYVYHSDDQVASELDANGNWLQTYFYFGSRPVGLYRNANTGFYHQDHLGSTRLVTLSDKSVYDNMDFLPFGQQIGGGNGTTHKFTGKERDGESGLDNFGARYGSSSMGRFMSPDPENAGADATDPQSWNAYSYVENNPLIFIDPTGLDCVYLDDMGQGVQNIDHNSNIGECEQHGGFWANGWINRGWVQTDPFSDNITIYSRLDNGIIAKSYASQTWTQGPFGLDDTFPPEVNNSGPADALSPSAQQAALAIHDRFAKLPNVCSLTFAANAGAPAGRMRVGVEYNTDTGFAFRGRAQGGIGPVRGRVTVNSKGKVSTSIRVGGTYGVTLGVTENGISSIGASANVSKYASVGVSGQIRNFYDCRQ